MLQFAREALDPWHLGAAPTPVGPLAVAWSAEVVVAASFDGLPVVLLGRPLTAATLPSWLEQIATQAYREGLAETPWTLLDPGTTSLQQAALAAAARIPAGTLASYGDVAQAIGRPRAARAVGQAMSRSPAALLIPTHRVVRHNGQPAAGQEGGVGERLRQWEAEHAVEQMSVEAPQN
jgi:O-6-methylguanine DNA methyltransferase